MAVELLRMWARGKREGRGSKERDRMGVRGDKRSRIIDRQVEYWKGEEGVNGTIDIGIENERLKRGSGERRKKKK